MPRDPSGKKRILYHLLKHHHQEPSRRNHQQDHDGIIAGCEHPLPDMRPPAGPVPPHIDGEPEHIRAQQGVRDERDGDGRDAADLADESCAGVVAPGELGLVDPLPLDLEGGDEPERDDEHQDVVDRHADFFHGVDEVAGLGRHEEELEGEDEHDEPEREHEPDGEPAGRDRERPADDRHGRRDEVAQRLPLRHRQQRDCDEDDAHDEDELELRQQLGKEVRVRRDEEHRNDHEREERKAGREDTDDGDNEDECDLGVGVEPVEERVLVDVLEDLGHPGHRLRSATIRPFSMVITRSAQCSAISRLCVMMTMVWPFSWSFLRTSMTNLAS